MGHAPPRPRPDPLRVPPAWIEVPTLDPPRLVGAALAVVAVALGVTDALPVAAILSSVAATLIFMPRRRATEPRPVPYLPGSVNAGSMAARAVTDYMADPDGDWIDLELRLDELAGDGTYDDPSETAAWELRLRFVDDELDWLRRAKADRDAAAWPTASSRR